MKLVATLACRNNSSRLYGKPLQNLKNKTVIDYIIDRLEERNEIDEIVLAISENRGNEAFLDVAERRDIKYVLGDDKDVQKRLIKACEIVGGDTIFRMTSECPFPYLEGFPYALEIHIKNKSDYTTYKDWPDGSIFELIKLEAIKKAHNLGVSRHRSELCTLFMNENPKMFNLNILELPEKFRRPDYRITIDYPEDLILCRNIIKQFGEDSYIPYDKLIKYLDDNPKVREIVEGLDDNYFSSPFN